MLTIVILAIRAEMTTWDDSEIYGKERIVWLKSFPELLAGIPSHDTFN